MVVPQCPQPFEVDRAAHEEGGDEKAADRQHRVDSPSGAGSAPRALEKLRDFLELLDHALALGELRRTRCAPRRRARTSRGAAAAPCLGEEEGRRLLDVAAAILADFFCWAGGGAAERPSSKRPSEISDSSRFLAPATVKPSS